MIPRERRRPLFGRPSSVIAAVAILILAPASTPAESVGRRAPDRQLAGMNGHPAAPMPLGGDIRQIAARRPVMQESDFWCGTGRFLPQVPMEAEPLRGGIVFQEVEPNDTAADAQYYPLGTQPGLHPDISWTGDFGALPVVNVQSENDDSTGLANETTIVFDSSLTLRQRVVATGTIGDGQFGNTTGDFDFFAIDVSQGSRLAIRVTSTVPAFQGGLDGVVAIYDRFGNLLAANDGGNTVDLNPQIVGFLNAPSQTLYVCVAGWNAAAGTTIGSLPADATTDNTGPGAAQASKGGYTVEISVNDRDADLFKVSLAAGDVLGLRTSGTARYVYLFDEAGELIAGSQTNLSSILPAASPLPRGGIASLAYVIPRTAVYHVAVLNDWAGEYRLDAVVRRPGFETDQPGYAHQILYLDFDGATINPSIFGGPNQQRVLTPFATFFGQFVNGRPDYPLLGPYFICAPEPQGEETPEDLPPPFPIELTPQEAFDILKRKIIERFIHVLSEDLKAAGGNGDFTDSWVPGDFRVTVLNSFEHADIYGQPNVSKIIIGGTQGELGVTTVGIASSVDPGNFSRQDIAVVLLDTLSGFDEFFEPPYDPRLPFPAPNPLPFSLNSYIVTAVFPFCVDGYKRIPGAEEGDPPTFEIEIEREEFIEEYFFKSAEASTPFDLIATGIANIAAHEAVHFLGGFHTNGFNDFPNIIDEGPGGLPNMLGLGPDLMWGPVFPLEFEDPENPPDPSSADDIELLNRTDSYSFLEGLFGEEQTAELLAWGMATGKSPGLFRTTRLVQSPTLEFERADDVVVAITGSITGPNVIRVRPQLQDRSVRVTINGVTTQIDGVDELWVLGGEGDDVINSPMDTTFGNPSPGNDPRFNIRIGGGKNTISLGDRFNFEPNALEFVVQAPAPGRAQYWFPLDLQDRIAPRLEVRGFETIALPNEVTGFVVR